MSITNTITTVFTHDDGGGDSPSDTGDGDSSEPSDDDDDLHDLPAINEYNDDEVSGVFLHMMATTPPTPPLPWSVYIWVNRTGVWNLVQLQNHEDIRGVHPWSIIRLHGDLLRLATQIKSSAYNGLCHTCAPHCRYTGRHQLIEKKTQDTVCLCVKCGAKITYDYTSCLFVCQISCGTNGGIEIILDIPTGHSIQGGLLYMYQHAVEGSGLLCILREKLSLSGRLYLDRQRYLSKTHTQQTDDCVTGD